MKNSEIEQRTFIQNDNCAESLEKPLTEDVLEESESEEATFENRSGVSFERTLQKSGRGSMALVLPHAWVNKSGLKSHDKIYLKWQSDGSLRIAPMRESASESGIYLIDGNHIKQPHGLGRSVISAYIEGYSKMKITSNGGLTKQQYDDVLAHASKLIGIAIIGENTKSVEIKCYLDPFKNDIPQLFVRIYSLSSAMLKDSLEALVNCDRDVARRVKNMDSEVDRIYYLILRQLFISVRDPAIAESNVVARPLSIVSGRSIAQLIEDIGDTCHNSCTKLIAKLNVPCLPEELRLRALELSGQLSSLYDKAFRAYSLADRTVANIVIDGTRAFERSVEELEDIVTEKKLGYFTYAFVNELTVVSRHCKSMAEIAFNMGVGADKENILTEDKIAKP